MQEHIQWRTEHILYEKALQYHRADQVSKLTPEVKVSAISVNSSAENFTLKKVNLSAKSLQQNILESYSWK